LEDAVTGRFSQELVKFEVQNRGFGVEDRYRFLLFDDGAKFLYEGLGSVMCRSTRAGDFDHVPEGYDLCR